jgi:hypothetical protein
MIAANAGSNSRSLAAFTTTTCRPLTRAVAEERYPRDIATRPAEAGDEAALHRIIGRHEDDRYGCGGGLRRFCRKAVADDHGHLTMHQIGGEARQPIQVIVGPAILDRRVLAVDEPCLLQALVERGDQMHERPGRRAAEESDRGNRGPLCAHGARHRDDAARSAADECATIHREIHR